MWQQVVRLFLTQRPFFLLLCSAPCYAAARLTWMWSAARGYADVPPLSGCRICSHLLLLFVLQLHKCVSTARRTHNVASAFSPLVSVCIPFFFFLNRKMKVCTQTHQFVDTSITPLNSCRLTFPRLPDDITGVISLRLTKGWHIFGSEIKMIDWWWWSLTFQPEIPFSENPTYKVWWAINSNLWWHLCHKFDAF